MLVITRWWFICNYGFCKGPGAEATNWVTLGRTASRFLPRQLHGALRHVVPGHPDLHPTGWPGSLHGKEWSANLPLDPTRTLGQDHRHLVGSSQGAPLLMLGRPDLQPHSAIRKNLMAGEYRFAEDRWSNVTENAKAWCDGRSRSTVCQSQSRLMDWWTYDDWLVVWNIFHFSIYWNLYWK